MAHDLLPGRIGHCRLALEDGDERVGRVADLEQRLAGRGASLLAELGEGLELGRGEHADGGTWHAYRVRGHIIGLGDAVVPT